MTDELTPEQEADISRLLAEARHDEPITADVAARLDAVLGDLSADDLEVFEVATVTDLDGVRRRRRNAGRLLVAAAAVVVGGVAIGQNLDSADMGGDSPSASSGEADDAASAPRDTNDAAGGDTGAQSENAPEVGADGSSFLLDGALRFTSDNFAAEAEQQLGDETKVRREASFSSLDAVQAYAAQTLFTCPDADYGIGAKLPAYYDEQEAVLVLRRPVAGVQRVDLLECGTADELATTELPTR